MRDRKFSNELRRCLLRVGALQLVGLMALVGLAVLASPASAQNELPCTPTPDGSGAATCTVHLGSQTSSMTVTPVTCPGGTQVPGGNLTTTIVNQVFHIAVVNSSAGAVEIWATGTSEGTFVFVAAPSGMVFTGHFALWFGDSINLNNAVFHFNANFVGSAADGTAISVHFVGHFNLSATGMTNMFMQVTC